MYIFKKTYKELAARFKALCPSIKLIDLWNNQVDNNEVKDAPALYIEFLDFDWVNAGNGKGILQNGTGIILLRIVQQKFTSAHETQTAVAAQQDDALSRFDVVQEVHYAAQGYASDTIDPLARKTTGADIDHDELIVDMAGYMTVLKDKPDENSPAPEAADKYNQLASINDIVISKGERPEDAPAAPVTNEYII